MLFYFGPFLASERQYFTWVTPTTTIFLAVWVLWDMIMISYHFLNAYRIFYFLVHILFDWKVIFYGHIEELNRQLRWQLSFFAALAKQKLCQVARCSEYRINLIFKNISENYLFSSNNSNTNITCCCF